MNEPLVTCSFCNKHKDAVAKLIVGAEVAICNECVELCNGLLQDTPELESHPSTPNLDPRAIKAHLDQYAIGQDEAKIVLSVAVANHYKRVSSDAGRNIAKSNILLLGPTGSGKTLLARSVARYLDVPFVIADATSLTEAGYVGDDVESMISRLYAAADNDIERCQRGIVFVDEIDKISRRGENASITRDVSGEGVQQALLKLVEGTRCRITAQGNRKHPQGDHVEIDTSQILFIAGGAFVGLDNLVRSRIRGTGVGFQAKIAAESEPDLDQVTPDDLVRFGMIPEFVGRFPTWVALRPLAREDLRHILTGVKDSLISQYEWLFQIDGCRLEFEPAALDCIVDRTLSNRTGARGLQSELERVLMPHMFNLQRYREQALDCVTVTVDLVNTPTNL